MTWKPIDGRGLNVANAVKHVQGLKFGAWRPSFIVLHNTGNPALYPLANHGSWQRSTTPPKVRVNENLVDYYKNPRPGKGAWNSGPHVFVADDLIWLFTPFTTQGTHSPSWNGLSWGIELVGDYDKEAFDSGPGAKVRDNAVALLAALHSKAGINPETLRLHKEDKLTTHDCPGKNVKKADVIRRVQEYMGHAGEHTVEDEAMIVPPQPRVGVTNTNGLNLRVGPSASSNVLSVLDKGIRLAVLGEAMNGTTKWLRVKAHKEGWVAARFVDAG